MSQKLCAKIAGLLHMLRETPVVKVSDKRMRIFTKLEGHNPVGSVKDRPALWILWNALGASIRSKLIDQALIDDVVTVPEIETVRAYHTLLMRHGLFVGGSSGSCYAAIERLASFRRSASASSTWPSAMDLRRCQGARARHRRERIFRNDPASCCRRG